MQLVTPAHIEALLFAEGGPLPYKRLATLLHLESAILDEALIALQKRLEGTGLCIIRTDTEVALAVSPISRDVVGTIIKNEERDIGDAGLEVLAILLYEGPSSRASIDYIRGVNSSYTLRALLSRGLIERSGNPEDGREYVYRPTTELMAHLGVRSKEELPDHATIAAELATFKSTQASHGGEQ